MKKTRSIAFIVELLLLFVLLLFIITAVTKIFMQTRSQSLRARRLTEAVCVAEEVAEVTAAAGGKTQAAGMLDGLEQTSDVRELPEGIELDMLFDEKEGDLFHVTLQWTETAGGGAGRFADETILVFFGNSEEPIYRLETGNYYES